MYLDKALAQTLFDHHGLLFFPKVHGPMPVFGKTAEFEDYSQHLPGQFMPLGSYSYSQSFFGDTSFIGRYCSIGADVDVMGNAHPTDWVSSSPAFYRKRRAKSWGSHRTDFPDFDDKTGAVSIGHDVWIGDGVLLGHNVKIGTGAVVAARSIVTRDVPPYAIVAGSPARIVRYRFDPSIVKDLLASCWWQWPLETWDDTDITDVAALLRQAEANQPSVQRMPEKRQTAKDLLRTYMARADPLGQNNS